MVIVAVALQEWSDSAQILFAFSISIVLVWWGEKRRARKLVAREGSRLTAQSQISKPTKSSQSIVSGESRYDRQNTQAQTTADTTKKIISPARTYTPPKNDYAAIVQAGKASAAELSEITKRTEKTQSHKVGRKASQNTQAQTTADTTKKIISPARTYTPPKNDYVAIVQAGRASAAELSEIAKRTGKTRSHKVGRKTSWKTGWISASKSVTVAGREIGGLVYVGTPPLLNDHGYRDKCRAYIDPSLPVARAGTDKVGNGMPYWPGYSEIPPQCRATYLEWLENGRADTSYGLGYMFLYFYGLERRFAVDQPSEAEKQQILNEVRRLKDLYPNNGSVQRYLGEFIQLAQILLNDDVQKPVFDYRGWELPLSLKFSLGARIGQGDLLSADWILSWLLCHPDRRMRTPATRCFDEFRALFKLSFDERFPDGLKVNKPRKMLKGTYQAASGEFQGQLEMMVNEKPIPDISRLRKPVEIAQEIADEVMGSLDKLSRYLGRNPDGRGSLEAQALLPHQLWFMFPSEELEQLKSWASGIVENGGLIPVSDAIAQLEGARPDKLNKRQLIGTADALARIGYGFAPDPRFALRSPKIDEPVVIFDLGETISKLEDVSPAYRAALIETALGSFVAHADGQITESERKSLHDKAIKATGLNEQEKRRLVANLDWMLAVAPDMTLLRRKLKDTDQQAQASIRSALVAAAHADGVIQPEEVAGIEKIYKALGLDPALVYSDLHAGEVSGGPIRVRAADAGANGVAIPDEKPDRLLQLDATRVAAIRSDTERASSVLGEIFDVAADEPDSESIAHTVLPGLDTKHALFVRELVTKDHWTEEAFHELCSRLGMMAAGAIENVNEWAFETYDDALLEEYDGYEVAPDIAEALKKKFEEEVQHVQA